VETQDRPKKMVLLVVAVSGTAFRPDPRPARNRTTRCPINVGRCHRLPLPAAIAQNLQEPGAAGRHRLRPQERASTSAPGRPTSSGSRTSTGATKGFLRAGPVRRLQGRDRQGLHLRPWALIGYLYPSNNSGRGGATPGARGLFLQGRYEGVVRRAGPTACSPPSTTAAWATFLGNLGSSGSDYLDLSARPFDLGNGMNADTPHRTPSACTTSRSRKLHGLCIDAGQGLRQTGSA